MTVHTAANNTRVKNNSANHLVLWGVVFIFATRKALKEWRTDYCMSKCRLECFSTLLWSISLVNSVLLGKNSANHLVVRGAFSNFATWERNENHWKQGIPCRTWSHSTTYYGFLYILSSPLITQYIVVKILWTIPYSICSIFNLVFVIAPPYSKQSSVIHTRGHDYLHGSILHVVSISIPFVLLQLGSLLVVIALFVSC